MADNLNTLEQLEREIANYHSKFQQSSEVIDDLAQVQVNFGELAQKYKDLKSEHQALTEYINQAQTEFATLQAKSKSIIDKVVQTEDNLEQCFTNFERTTSENINQALEVSNQRLINLEKTTQDRLEKRLYETQKFLNSLQTQSRDAVNKITQTQENFDQRFFNLQRTNLEQIKQTQESLNQRFTTFETTTESKWQKFQQQISSEISTLRQNDEKLKQEFEQKITELTRSIKHTRTIVYTAAAGLSMIAAIIAVVMSLPQVRNEGKDTTVLTPQISNPSQQ